MCFLTDNFFNPPVNPPPKAGCPVSAASFVSALTSGPMAETHPAMMEAIQCIRAEGLKTAVLSNNFFLSDGNTYLPLDRSLFDVVSFSLTLRRYWVWTRMWYNCLTNKPVLSLFICADKRFYYRRGNTWDHRAQLGSIKCKNTEAIDQRKSVNWQ